MRISAVSEERKSNFSTASAKDPEEKAWFQGDTLFYQEYGSWGPTLRSVPLSGGTATSYQGYFLDMLDIAGLIAFGFKDTSDDGLQLFQLSATAAPTPIGD